jgi:hypothetical protein
MRQDQTIKSINPYILTSENDDHLTTQQNQSLHMKL